jgi:cytochrome c553
MKPSPAAIIAFLACAVAGPAIGAAERPVPDKVKVCTACHGADGKAVISPYPNLAGQNRDYLMYALKAYKAGNRSGGAGQYHATAGSRSQ